MNDFKQFNHLLFEFGDDHNTFTDRYAGKMTPVIKEQMRDLMFTHFVKEIEAQEQYDLIDVKYRNKFYDKLFKTKKKLISKDRADAWFDKVFQRYFIHGVLEHLIVHAIMFLYKRNLFVPQRLFAQIDNNDLLARFTASACEYLGWTGQSESVEPLVTDESEEQEEAPSVNEQPVEGDSEAPNEAAVVVYESKEVEPVVDAETNNETSSVIAERTVTETREVVTVPVLSEKELPSFFRPGGKSDKK